MGIAPFAVNTAATAIRPEKLMCVCACACDEKDNVDSSLIRPSCVINYTVCLFFFTLLRVMFMGGKINIEEEEEGGQGG